MMSQSLVDELASSAGYRRLHQLCTGGNYLVIPAFEVLLDRTLPPDQTTTDQLETALRRASLWQSPCSADKIAAAASFATGLASSIWLLEELHPWTWAY